MYMCICDETIKRWRRGEEGSLREGEREGGELWITRKRKETICEEEGSITLQLPKDYTRAIIAGEKYF